jgi:hypothetical protein
MPARQNCTLALAEPPLAGLTSGLAYVNPLAAQLDFAFLLLTIPNSLLSLLYPLGTPLSLVSLHIVLLKENISKTQSSVAGFVFEPVYQTTRMTYRTREEYLDRY